VFVELASIVAPVYLVAALGFGWARLGRPFDTRFVTDIVMNVGGPCLVFSSLVGLEMERDTLVAMAGATLAALAGFALVGAALLRAARLPLHTFLGPITFANTGNLGLPICFFAFGDEGLAYAVCIFAVVSLVHFTAGQWVWSGRVDAAGLLRTPLAWACLAAVLVLWTGVGVPRWLARSTDLVAGLTIPLMQISLGVSLARLRVADLRRSFALSVLRLGMGTAVGVALAWAFGFEGTARGVLILDCAMPAAVFNYMMAERYARDAEQVASIVVVSTLLAFALLPLLVAWLVAGGRLC